MTTASGAGVVAQAVDVWKVYGTSKETRVNALTGVTVGFQYGHFTAITAATLMIGIALVTGVSIIASSLKASIEKMVNQDLGAVLLISEERPTAMYDPAVIEEVKQIP